MSGLLAGKVWQSNLDPNLKPLAALLADIADDEGDNIYPSVAYIGWLTGRSRRQVQDGLKRLRDSGVLIIVSNPNGGRGKSTQYKLDETALPARKSWRETRLENGADIAPLEEKGAETDTKGAVHRAKRAQYTAPDPLEEPLVKDPLGSFSLPRARENFDEARRSLAAVQETIAQGMAKAMQDAIDAPPAHPFSVAYSEHYRQNTGRLSPPATHTAECLALERDFGAALCIEVAEDFGWQKPPNYLRPIVQERQERKHERRNGSNGNGATVSASGGFARRRANGSRAAVGGRDVDAAWEQYQRDFERDNQRPAAATPKQDV